MGGDIYLQRFEDGDAAPADALLLAGLIAPYADAPGPDLERLVFADGGAAIAGADDLVDGFTVADVEGAAAWDFLVDAARQADLAILPAGRPTAVTHPDALAALPAGLAAGAVVVRSGAALRAHVAG